MLKTSIFFSMDSLLASSILLVAVLLVSNFYIFEQRESNVLYTSQDFVKVLSTIKVKDMDNDYVKSMIASGKIANINNTFLDQIGDFWANGNIELARNLTINITNSSIPKKYGFSVLINGEEIYSRNLSVNRVLVSSRKMISGIAKAKPTLGYTSRAYISKITSKTNTKHYPFDIIAPCYNSFGDSSNADSASIEYTIELPQDAQVINATWIIVPAIAPTPVNAYINDKFVFSGYPNENSIVNAQGNFTSGVNKVRYSQTVGYYGGCPGDDGTSDVILTYKTKQIQTLDNKTKFPFAVVYADGRISDYEKPIFAPNIDIGKINISLKLNASSAKLSFRLRDKTIDIGNKDVINKSIEWRDDEIKNNLSKNGINYGNLKDTYFYFIFDFKPINNNLTIFPNSSVTIEGSQPGIPFGYIDVSQRINVVSSNNVAPYGWCPISYRDVSWGYKVPDNALPLYTDFLIGWCWVYDSDQTAKANDIYLYKHLKGNSGTDPFIAAFARYGYTKNTASGSIAAGQNNFDLHFGSNYATRPSFSFGENVFVVPNSGNYSSVLGKAEGCTWTVAINGGGNKVIRVPTGYSGSNNCIYNPTGIVYNSNDSVQAAALEMLKLLDLDNDADADLLISEGDLEISTIVYSNTPSLWGPAIIEIKVWE